MTNAKVYGKTDTDVFVPIKVDDDGALFLEPGSVGSGGGGGGGTTDGLTDTQLRAAPVPVSGTVALDATALAALETINAIVSDGGGSITIDGTVSVSGTVPVSGPLTDAQLRAAVVPVALDATSLAALESITVGGTVDLGATSLAALESITATGPLTDTQLRASSVPVSDGGGSLTVDGTVGISGTVPISGALTDTQLRATAVPVSGTVTATGPLTDTQLRATAVPVSLGTNTPDVTDRSGRLLGHVTVDSAPTTAVTGPLTDTQLRATAVPVADGGGSITVDGTVAATQSGAWNVTNVSGTVSLPTGAATLAEQQTQTTSLQLIDDIVRSEDEASADGHKGAVVLGVRKGTPANTSGTDGDYEALQVSAGRLWTSAVVDTALPAGTNAIGKLAANDGVDVGDVTVNNASGASAVNIQDGGNSITVDGTVAVSGSVAVTGPLTDTQIRATALPVSGTVTANAGTNLNTSALALESGGNLATLVSRLPAQGQAAMAASTPVVIASNQSTLPVTPAAGELHLGEIGGNLVITSTSFTRPSDTTAYAAGDAVNNSTSAPTIMTFANCGRVTGGSGYIVGVRVMKSSTGISNANFRLHIYHTTVTMINDNTALTVLYANVTKRVGVVDLSFSTDGSDGAEAQDFSLRLPFKCDGGDSNLYGVLQAKGGYTPANGEQFTFELSVDRN